VEAALSKPHRDTALRVFQETLPTRLNDPIESAIVVVMQRLHEEDVSGFILAGDYGYEHLCLPMEFEPDRKCVTSIGFEDPRTEEGELLFPERFPAEVVERDKKVMGSYATAGQFQQRPAPRGDTFFEWEKMEIVQAVPRMRNTIRYWDKAGTEGGGAYTAGVLMGLGEDGLYYVLDVVRVQRAAVAREKAMRRTAELDGTSTIIWIEQEGGSGGKESAEATIANMAGYAIYKERPTGDKALRAEPFSVQVEAGNVRVLKGEWNKEYFDELKTFPVGKYKDQVDASSGAFNKLAVQTPVGVLVPKHISQNFRRGN
jgi:predicted phage terminase large subunit-like protein